jgi:hypothetical protein
MHLFTQPANLLPCSNSAINGNDETNRILYYDIAVETIIDLPHVSLLEPAFRIVGFLGCFANVNPF